ncbi:aldolase/citrate lyase family protein [Variovorax sp. LjRoot84]
MRLPLISLKQRAAAAGAAVSNGYCMMPGTFGAEIFASQGFDCVTVDLQHGLIGYSEAIPMLQLLSRLDVTPLVRVPALDEGVIMQMLDAGAMGVTCPMIETREQAERLVEYAYYPPVGCRSFGPILPLSQYGSEYLEQANSSIATFAMIETARGVENIEAITEVEGLTGIYLGTMDLAMSLGRPRAKLFEDEVLDAAVSSIVSHAKRRGLIVGLLVSGTGGIRKSIDFGFNFITAATDIGAMRSDAERAVKDYKKALELPIHSNAEFERNET